MLRRLIPLAAGLSLAALAMAAPAMASPAAHAAPVHAAAHARVQPDSGGYCTVNGYGWYVSWDGTGGDEVTGNSSCTTGVAWREQSDGSYEMSLNNTDTCVNTGSNEAAYANSCVANFSPEEWLARKQANGTYALENVHYALYLFTLGNGTQLLIGSVINPTSEWTW